MEFPEILEKFRALGGVADNVELRHGQIGRGIFPINPNLPIKIKAPAHLLASPSWLHLDRDNHIRVNKRLGLEPAFISFYEDYQKFFGWSNGGLEELSAHHSALRGLSKTLKQYLLLFGWVKSDFDSKTINNHMNDYFVSRQIGIENESKLMPMLELINHSSTGKQYIIKDGVHVKGVFETEVLTCYRKNFDAFHFFRNYHFATGTSTALSCNVKIEVPDIGTINISRFDSTFDIKDGVIRSKITKNNSEINISFLELVSDGKITSPRKEFADRMHEFHLPAHTSNEIFDGLIIHNRKALEDMIVECKLSSNRIAKELESIAVKQLELLK
jgi:hypothetical protein